ncbi:MAG: hypothetical protein J5998_12105, partial [Clostridia bacterium]|nr:hypothetical protein [Clostridia bacterium]
MNTKAANRFRPVLGPIAALGLIVVIACALAQFLPVRRADLRANIGSVVISEVMTKNERTVEDDFGDYPDWIELANAG